MNEIITSVLQDWFGDSMYKENKYEAKQTRLLILRVLKRLTNNLWLDIDREEYNRLDERNAILEKRKEGI